MFQQVSVSKISSFAKGSLRDAGVFSKKDGLDYSPYGTLLNHRHGVQTNTESYRYAFQGQEKDDEIKGEGNSYNYEYRMHDPRIGRFFAVDPLASSYPYYTPYQFSGNRPIDCVELEGLEPSKVGVNGLIPRSFWHSDLTVAIGAGFINAMVDDGVGLYYFIKMLDAFNPTGITAYKQEGRELRAQAWEMLKVVSLIMSNPRIQNIVIEEAFNSVAGTVKNMDAADWTYTVGYTGWQVVSMFIGIGEINAMIKGGKFAAELPKLIKGLQIAEDVIVTVKKIPEGCFIGGTEVLVEGNYVNIEEIRMGEMVWEFNKELDKSEQKMANGSVQEETMSVYRVYFGNEMIEVADGQYLLVNGKWVKINDLKVGDVLTLYDGTSVLIVRLEIIQ